MNKKILSLLLTGSMLFSASGNAMALEFTSEDLFAYEESSDVEADVTQNIFTDTEAEDTAAAIGEWATEDDFLPIQDIFSTVEEVNVGQEDSFTQQEEVIFLSEDEILDQAVGEVSQTETETILQDAEVQITEEDTAIQTDLTDNAEEDTDVPETEITGTLQDLDSILTASVASVVLEETEERYIEAGFPEDRHTLPYWETWLDKESWLYVEDEKYDEGWDFPLYFSNLTFSDPDLVQVEDLGDQWKIRSGGQFGETTVTLNYEEPEYTHKSGTCSFKLAISGDVYELDITSVDGTYRLLPGKQLTLAATARHYAFNQQEGHYNEDAGTLEFEWSLPDNGAEGLEILSTGNGDALDLPELVSGSTAVIQARAAGVGGYPVRVTAYETASG